jgi:integrase
MALTVKQVERVRDAGRYPDGRGLYLQVTEHGAKSWLFRYERGGRERMMGLGSAADYTLEEARERARKMRHQLNEGVDPIDSRRALRAQQATDSMRIKAAGVTFEACAREYHATHAAKWSSAKYAQQFLTTLESYAFPVFGDLPVAAVDQAMVLRALDKIWARIPSTAERVRNRVEMVLHYAKARGYREGDNPASRDAIKYALPESNGAAAHHAALPFGEVAQLMAELRARPGVPARALEFCILTAARSGEVRGARWDEVDLGARTWIVPPERMKTGKKTGKEHRVPLSNRALEILEALPREGKLVFVGPTAGAAIGINALSDLLKILRPASTVHGLRSTFRDWAAECTNFPNHVVEQALAHSIGSAVEAAYRRGDLLAKRIKLMDAWATYCNAAPAGDNVVSIRKSVTVR